MTKMSLESPTHGPRIYKKLRQQMAMSITPYAQSDGRLHKAITSSGCGPYIVKQGFSYQHVDTDLFGGSVTWFRAVNCV